MNLIIIDNFLPYPNVVRGWALSQEFCDCETIEKVTGKPNTWPGLRTYPVHELDSEYANIVLTRISNIVSSSFGFTNLEIASAFQLTTKDDGDSWIHMDDNVLVAGLIYLTPNAPVDSGTILYTRPPHEVRDVVGNVFNRLVLYKASEYHKSAKYFGHDKISGRLTQVIFITQGKQ